MTARAVVVAVVLGATPLAAEAITPPTGDATAIRFFDRQAAAYRGVTGVSIVETGYYFVRPGAHRSVAYWWGSVPPAGYRPATATIEARLEGGKIVAYVAQLNAPRVRRLRIVMAGGTVFTSTTACWTKSAASASPLGTGERFLFNDGGASFTRLAGRTVTFSYRWAPGATATETATFASKHAGPVRISIDVAGARPLSIRESIAPLAAAPPLPVPSPPARPVPKPLCS